MDFGNITAAVNKEMMNMGRRARSIKRTRTNRMAVMMIVLIITGLFFILQFGWAEHWQPELFRMLALGETQEGELPNESKPPADDSAQAEEPEEPEPAPPDSSQTPEAEKPAEPKKPPASEKPSSPTLRVAYLTLDDGPSKNTPKVLDILAEEKAVATFFVIGNDTEFGHRMYRRILAEGHALGNHTYSHDYSRIYTSQEDFLNDFYKLEDLLDRVVGIRPKIMRFPGGSANHSSHLYAGPDFMSGMTGRILAEGYLYFDWNVSSADSASRTPPVEDIIQAVKNGIENKDEVMILFHDTATKTTTVEALPVIIQHLREAGFTFRVIGPQTPGFRFQQSR